MHDGIWESRGRVRKWVGKENCRGRRIGGGEWNNCGYSRRGKEESREFDICVFLFYIVPIGG